MILIVVESLASDLGGRFSWHSRRGTLKVSQNKQTLRFCSQWARRSKMFSNKQAKIPLCDVRGQELSQEWQRWARREETVR